MILSLTNDIKKFINYKKAITIDDIFSLKNDSGIKIIKNKPRDKEHVKKTYKYCEKIYLSLLSSVSKELNQLHKLKNNTRYWEIIIGVWLREFILLSHKNYFNCKRVLRYKKFKKYLAVKDGKYKIHTRNTIESIYATIDSEWNFALNSKIFSFLNTNIQPVYLKTEKNIFRLQHNVNNDSKLKMLSSLKFINNFSKQNRVFVYNTSLPFLHEKKLELAFGQAPSIWNSKEPKYSNISNEFRKNFNLQTTRIKKIDKFEIFIRQIIPEALPIFIMETFKDNLELSSRLGFPIKPRKIFTSLAHSADELFKIYLAEQINKKAKYYCGQHGNNYFTAYQTNFSVDIRTSDKFLSWGYNKSQSNKIIPSFNLKCVGKLHGKRYFKKNGNLLIICNIPGHNRSPIERNDLEEKQIVSTFSILENLRKEIKTNTILRISQSFKEQFKGYYFKKYFSKTKFKVDLLEKVNLRSQQSRARLNFFNYYSTGMLENLLLDIPSICYLDKDYEYYNDFLMQKLNFLIKAKIVFFSKQNFISHINSIWDNVDLWWKSSKTQELIAKFNSNFNHGENNINKIVKILKA